MKIETANPTSEMREIMIRVYGERGVRFKEKFPLSSRSSAKQYVGELADKIEVDTFNDLPTWLQQYYKPRADGGYKLKASRNG